MNRGNPGKSRPALNHNLCSDDQMPAIPCFFSLETVSTNLRDSVMDLISSFANGMADLAGLAEPAPTPPNDAFAICYRVL
jgi:hypothetical protein